MSKYFGGVVLLIASNFVDIYYLILNNSLSDLVPQSTVISRKF